MSYAGHHSMIAGGKRPTPDSFAYLGLYFDKPHGGISTADAYCEIGQIGMYEQDTFWSELKNAVYIGWGSSNSTSGDAGKWRCGGATEAPSRVVQNQLYFSCIEDLALGYANARWTRPMFFPFRLNAEVSIAYLANSLWMQYTGRYASIPSRAITSASLWLSADKSMWYCFGTWSGVAPAVDLNGVIISTQPRFTGETSAFDSYLKP